MLSISAKYFPFKEDTVIAGFPFFQFVEVGKLLPDHFYHRRIKLGDALKVTASLVWIPRTYVGLAASVQRLHIIYNINGNTDLQYLLDAAIKQR